MRLPHWRFRCQTATGHWAALLHNRSLQTFPSSLSMLACVWQQQHETTHICGYKSARSKTISSFCRCVGAICCSDESICENKWIPDWKKRDYSLNLTKSYQYCRNSDTYKTKGGATHRQTVPNENTEGQQEGWVSGERVKDPKVSEMAWTDVKSDKRQSWQAPAWVSVTIPSLGSGRCHHHANASLCWSVTLGAVVQNGCRQANTLVRATECAFFSLSLKGSAICEWQRGLSHLF